MRDSDSAPAQVGLLRALGRWDLLTLVINGIIGAGIFGLPAKVQALLGVYGLAAILVCAAIIGLVILWFAEVASRFTQTGGARGETAAAGPVRGGVGLFHIDWARLQRAAALIPEHFANTVLVLGFAFVGCQNVVVAAGEARDPRRDLPRALVALESLLARGDVRADERAVERIVVFNTGAAQKYPEAVCEELPLLDIRQPIDWDRM